MDQFGEELMRILGQPTGLCSQCGISKGTMRCMECLQPSVYCCQCLLEDHMWRSLHRIEVSFASLQRNDNA
jgi:predicted amidophosphoribosyltransferase